MRQVLLRFHHQLSLLKSARKALNSTADELYVLGSMAVGLPFKAKKRFMEMLEKVHSEWLLIRKNRKVSTVCQKQREQKFTENLDTVFSIVDTGKVLSEQQLDFLADQDGQRKLTFAALNGWKVHDHDQFNEKSLLPVPSGISILYSENAKIVAKCLIV